MFLTPGSTSNGCNESFEQSKLLNNVSETSILEDVSSGSFFRFTPNLPADVDIFSSLPDYVYENPSVCSFLRCLKKAIYKNLKLGKLLDISLPKLHISERTASSLTIDWIFSYFRLFFSFDKDEGNMYGIIEIDDIQKRYFSDSQKIDENNCEILAENLLQYVVNNLQQ